MVLAWIYDISSIKRAEKALEEKTSQLQTALDNMPGGMFMVDGDLNLILINKQYSDLFEFPDGMLSEGGNYRVALKYKAERGDFGRDNDVEKTVARVLARMLDSTELHYERALASGRVLDIQMARTPNAGSVVVATDVTERKLAETELADQKTVLEAVLENMDQGVVMYDADLKVRVFNEQARRHLGLSKDVLFEGAAYEDMAREFIGRGGQIDVGVEQQVVNSVAGMRSGDTGAIEFTPPDGRTLEVRRRPMPGGGMVATQTDITERKKADKAVEQRRQELLDILEACPIGVTVQRRTGERLFVNTTQVRNFGASSKEELLAWNMSNSYFDAGDRALVLRTAVGGANIEVRRRRMDGSEWWCLVGSRGSIQFADDSADVVYVLDITERKRDQQILQAVLEHMEQGIAMWDGNHDLLIVNDKLNSFIDLPPDLLRNGTPVVDWFYYLAERGDYVSDDAFGGDDIESRVSRTF